jgi:methionyl-tRNA formyltransferase
MRIVVNGQQAYGQAVLEALLERGEDVVGVYCAPDKEGQRPDPLKDYAVSKDVPVFQPASFKKKEVWDQMASLKPGLCVMAYVILLVPEEALVIPTHGTIQYHPSLLPKHRGPSAINWPIIQGEKKTGLSIFWPDKGLDTGPILLQKEVEITDEDTLGSVYFDKLFRLGVEAMMEAVDLVRAGNAPRLVQDETQATYESWCKKSDVEIDWSKSTR